ncbi:hypothetical protein AMECASPLE_032214 [Ameca splendens]|uniref:Secreted protein n=1 Tax=Ameca splendens TaxID=208324 RepID=A0ABV1A1Y1_9TELE
MFGFSKSPVVPASSALVLPLVPLSLHRWHGLQRYPHRASELHRGFESPWLHKYRCRLGPAAGLQTASSCVAGLQIACSVVADCLNSWSAGDSLRVVRQNSCPLRPPLSGVCFGFLLWASGIRP